MADDKKKRFLAETFNLKTLAKVALWSIPAFFVFGYVDNMIFDPLFFDIIHGSALSPEMSQWKGLVEANLGWMHDIVGFTSDGGLLHTDFAQSMLETHGGTFDVASGYAPAVGGTQMTPAVTPAATGGALPPMELAPSATG